MQISNCSCSASIGTGSQGNIYSSNCELNFSFQVSECCHRLLVKHQLRSGEWKGGGRLGGEAHGHRWQDEAEDEADARRHREVRRRGHLRHDQPAPPDVQQDQVEPSRGGGGSCDKVDQEESVADCFRNRHRRQSFKFDEKQASGRKTNPTFFIVFLQTFPLSVETDRAWRRGGGWGCGGGGEENEHF